MTKQYRFKVREFATYNDAKDFAIGINGRVKKLAIGYSVQRVDPKVSNQDVANNEDPVHNDMIEPKPKNKYKQKKYMYNHTENNNETKENENV